VRKCCEAPSYTLIELATDPATRLAVLVKGALVAGAHEAQPIVDAEDKPATATDCGHVLLLCLIDDTRKGFDRIDAFLLGDEDDDRGGQDCLGGQTVHSARAERSPWRPRSRPKLTMELATHRIIDLDDPLAN
jgi:hypothetical protein